MGRWSAIKIAFSKYGLLSCCPTGFREALKVVKSTNDDISIPNAHANIGNCRTNGLLHTLSAHSKCRSSRRLRSLTYIVLSWAQFLPDMV